MAALRIPKQNEAGFKILAALGDDSVQELVSALRKVSPVLYGPDLASRVASEVDTIPRSDVDQIAQVLLPLYLLRERYESSVPEIAEDVCQAMDRSDDEELRLSGEDRDQFKDHLIQLLDIEAVGVGAKALDVLFENQRSYISARIVTELRPIFGPNAEGPPAGALTVHMLKITYQEQGQQKEFFVALDTTDVGALSKVLDRADSKAESLKAFLAETEVPYIDPE